MIRRLRSGPSAVLKTTVWAIVLLGAASAGAQTSDIRSEPVSQPSPGAKADDSPGGFHDLICKPNGTEDGFDCADQATPARIVPIPSQGHGPILHAGPITG